MVDLIEQVRAVLAKYPDPKTGKPIEEAGRVMALRIEDDVVKFVLEFSNPQDASDFEGLRAELYEELKALDGIKDAQIISTASAAPAPPKLSPSPQAARKSNSGIKHIYAIGSGKGGVGKSTLTSNLAVALAKAGKKVGLLDADLYGPSQVLMMGVRDKPRSEKGRIIPNIAHDVRMISIGQMIPDGEAVIWRGPMLMKALEQFLNDVEWGELDALLIDLPPGTGDVQLSLAQKAKLSGAIIVSTPQDIALLDARRAISMFDKLNVPVIGLIENMAVHICSNCGHEEHIFGGDKSKVKDEAEKCNIPYLGALPLSMDIREAADNGQPAALAGHTLFNEIAARLIAGKMV